MRKAIHKNSGFTLMELMITIAVIGLLAAIAIPNMIGWRSGAKLRGAVENLRGDLQLSKLIAVQENGFVAVLFSGNGYQVFIDNGATPGALDAGERRIRDRQLDATVSIDLGSTDFNGNLYARFNNRGLPDLPGADDKVELVTSDGERREIKVTRVGRINIVGY